MMLTSKPATKAGKQETPEKHKFTSRKQIKEQYAQLTHTLSYIRCDWAVTFSHFFKNNFKNKKKKLKTSWKIILDGNLTPVPHQSQQQTLRLVVALHCARSSTKNHQRMWTPNDQMWDRVVIWPNHWEDPPFCCLSADPISKMSKARLNCS